MNPVANKKALFAVFALFITVVAASSIAYMQQGMQHKKDSVTPVGAEVSTTMTELPIVAFFDGAGKKITLADFKGKTVLVNLWATWCPPCVAELPSLDMLQAKLHDKNFAVVAISLDRGDMKEVKKFLADRGAEHLTAYQDKNREIAMSWKYSGVPVSFLVGPEGKLIAQYDGALKWEEGAVFDDVNAHVK